VERVAGGWRGTGQQWVYDADRYERVAATREAEQESMIAYARPADSPKATCRMSFLQQSLDDPTATPCGRCDVCAGSWYPTAIPAQATEAAAARLDRPGAELHARAQWPTGVERLGVGVRGKIGADEALQPGRAVARLTDLGWGQKLRALLGDDGLGHEASVGMLDREPPGIEEDPDAAEDPGGSAPPASTAPPSSTARPSPSASPASPSARSLDGPPDEGLLRACAQVLAAWDWERRPVAIVSIPSRRRPQLVSGIGRELGRLGRLPYLGELDLAHGGPTGQPGGNSAFRLAAVWERFVVGTELAARIAELADQPILLVDDLADSRWTMTVAGRELRRAGAGAVLPFALALAA